MTPEHARELLGGLATGILTPEERQTLFEAALHDQTLFNEVADELEFAVFLQSPETRAQLANRIEVEPARRRWWALRPAWLALSGVLAASTVLFVVLWHPNEIARPKATFTAPPAPPAPAALQSSPKMAKAVSSTSRVTAQVKRQPVVEELPKSLPAENREPRSEAALAVRDARMMAPRAAAPAPAAAPPAEPPVMAGSATTSLTGTVHDASGAPVAGATVDIVDPSTNTTTHMATDSSGRFVALSLPQGGPYTVMAAAPGFKKEQRSVTLDGNGPAQIDIPLQVGEMAQIAVLDFVNGSEQNQSGAQVADLLSSQLLNSGQVHVIDREKVQQAAQSQKSAGGRPQSAQEAAALGRSIGADAVIVGSVQASGAAGGGGFRKAVPNVLVTAQVIDTKQARPMVQAAANGVSLQGATKTLGNQLQSKLARPVEGSVTHLTGNIVSVKFVEAPVLRIGARCEVIRGARKIGELIITSVNGQYAVGRFSGTGQPRAGDRVTASR